MKKFIYIGILFVILIIVIGVSFMFFRNKKIEQSLANNMDNGNLTNTQNNLISLDYVNGNTTVGEVINDRDFEGFGNLIFPVDLNINPNTTLEDVGDSYIWYNNVSADKTVEIINYLKSQVESGNQVFYDIYTDEEKKEDPDKENTGLFFFRGNPGEKFAIVSAGGGMMYVGAMADSFPQCLELAKNGYNAFAIIYRPGYETAPQDLARAVAFIYDNAEKLGVDVKDYSLWGGSAGARMAAWVGNGTEKYGEKAYPRPAAVIMQYTGMSEVTGEEPPTYCCVGTSDGIASFRTMQNRIDRIKANGTNAEIEIFDGLPHGFGLGEGTVAEGWINNAIAFWKENMLFSGTGSKNSS